MKNLLKAFAWAVAAIIILLMISCNSSKKNSSSNKLDLDSTSKHLSEKSNTNESEFSTERNNNNWNANSSSTFGSDDVEITFDTSAYSGNRSTGEKTDSTPAFRKPGAIKIGRDKQGNLSIDPGGRNISKLKFKRETSSNQTNLQQSDSSSKLYAKQASEAKAKKLDSLNLIKKAEAENHAKNTRRFNWWWLLCLIPVAFYSYYKFKK